MNLERSSTVSDPSDYIAPESQPQNPYARRASRRAISCVTCAKAKTKCNKAVPACLRCITKGIVCEPRSTRRTSENKHRSNIRKQSTPPKKHHSIAAFSRFDQADSPRNSLPSSETGAMHSMPYDCYSTLKMNEQELLLSGYPILTPLPTETSYTTNESQPSSDDGEQNLADYEQTTSSSNFSSLGGLSPPTPEPVVFEEPVSMVHFIDYSLCPQSWCEEVSTSVEYGFGSNTTDFLSPEIWTMPNAAITMPSTSHTPWLQPHLMIQQPEMQVEQISYHDGFCSYPDSQPSLDDCFSSPMPDWTILEPTDTEFAIAASTSHLSNIQSAWEDSFICGSFTYQDF